MKTNQSNTALTLRLAGTTVLLSTLVACANSGARYVPIHDGEQSPTYLADLTECQTLAHERELINGDTKTDILVGAGVGAVAGAIDGDSDDVGGAIAGALIGAAVGAGNGAMEARDDRKAIVISCMQGRGHRVVG